jgi:hypothetical protein
LGTQRLQYSFIEINYNTIHSQRPPLRSSDQSSWLQKEIYRVSCEVQTEFIYVMQKKIDSLCDLVVRVPYYRSIGPGSIPGITRFFLEVVGLKRGPLSLVSAIEELLERKSSSCYGRTNPSR